MKRILSSLLASLFATAVLGANIVNQGQADPGQGAPVNASTASAITVTATHSLAIVVYAYPTGFPGLAISDGGISNTYQAGPLVSQGGGTSLTFLTGPVSGSTTGVLSAPFSGTTTSTDICQFSDYEVRGSCNLTNGMTTVSWTGALSATVGTALGANTNSALASQFFYAQNANSGSTAITATGGVSGAIAGVYVAEIANVGTSGALTFSTNYQGAPGGTTDVITTGSVTTSTASSVLFGFSYTDNTIGTSNALAAGTGLTGQTPSWVTIGGGTFAAALAEDKTVSTSTAATFTSANNGSANYVSFGAIFPPPAAGAAPAKMFLVQ